MRELRSDRSDEMKFMYLITQRVFSIWASSNFRRSCKDHTAGITGGFKADNPPFPIISSDENCDGNRYVPWWDGLGSHKISSDSFQDWLLGGRERLKQTIHLSVDIGFGSQVDEGFVPL